ncbi:MAG: hypothetical protein IT463_01900 [Planctomycetes bacterium]|nr:hypothetical protein [Planctomycetota bacterium]
MSARLLLLLVLACAPALHAALWDRDRQPDDRLPAVADLAGGLQTPRTTVLTERRRAAALARLQDVPDAVAGPEEAAAAEGLLPAFDDAAVAEARLGRYTEAIILMDRKFALGAKVAEVRRQRGHDSTTATLLNRAEFRVLAWLAGGAHRDNAAELRAARADLLQALELGGRQPEAALELRRVEWLLAGAPAAAEGNLPNLLGISNAQLAGVHGADALGAAGCGGTIEWLTRRLHQDALGRDVDAMHALSVACTLAGRDRDAAFCWFRLCDWARDGSISTIPGAPTGEALAARMKLHLVALEKLDGWRAEYDASCRDAAALNASRLRYLEQGLAKGEHPDTQADFWTRWSPTWDAPPAPEAPAQPENTLVSTALYVGAGIAVLILFAVVAAFAVFVGRAHPKSPTVDEL